MTLNRKALRKASWVLGALGVTGGITAYGYVSHAKGCNAEQIKAMQSATTLSVFNAVGIALLSRRKKTMLIAFPLGLLSSSIFLIAGALVVDRFYSSQGDRLKWMVPAGYGSAALGWLVMSLC